MGSRGRTSCFGSTGIQQGLLAMNLQNSCVHSSPISGLTRLLMSCRSGLTICQSACLSMASMVSYSFSSGKLGSCGCRFSSLANLVEVYHGEDGKSTPLAPTAIERGFAFALLLY